MPDREIRKHTIIAWMEDKPGVLNRVSGLFSRRNFNIESLTVGYSEAAGISRMTFVSKGTERDLRQIKTQLFKLINVTAVKDVTDEPSIVHELVMIKVKATNGSRASVMQLVDIYKAQIVDVTMDTLILQYVGTGEQVDSLIDLMDNFGIIEMVRTGSVAMVRGKGSITADITAESRANGHM